MNSEVCEDSSYSKTEKVTEQERQTDTELWLLVATERRRMITRGQLDTQKQGWA